MGFSFGTGGTMGVSGQLLGHNPSNFLSSMFKKAEQGAIGGVGKIGALNVAAVAAVEVLRGELTAPEEALKEILGGASTMGWG